MKSGNSRKSHEILHLHQSSIARHCDCFYFSQFGWKVTILVFQYLPSERSLAARYCACYSYYWILCNRLQILVTSSKLDLCFKFFLLQSFVNPSLPDLFQTMRIFVSNTSLPYWTAPFCISFYVKTNITPTCVPGANILRKLLQLQCNYIS